MNNHKDKGKTMKDVIKISKIKNVDFSPKVLAVMDIYMPSVDFTLKDARLIQGETSLFVGVNRFKIEKPYLNKQTNEMVEYVAPGWFGKKFQGDVNRIASEAYDAHQPVNVWYGDNANNYGNTTFESNATPHPLTEKVATTFDEKELPF